MMDRELIVTKKTLQAASAAPFITHKLWQRTGAAEQGANFGKNLAKCCHRTEILLPGAITRERSANAATN